MSDRIKGITIELDGDTTKLTDALKKVNKEIRDTQSDLRDVNKLLKMDPGNADLLAQKQKALSTAIESTKDKLKQEQEALAQLKAGPQNEDTIKQQEALTREIEATKQSLKGLEDEYKAFGSVSAQQLNAAGAKMKEVGGKISDVGEGLTKGITVPVAAAAGASGVAWKEVDEAMDTVTQKTGASGAALQDMQDRAKNIAETIPTDFQSAGDAIGEVNTRFGLTGDALEKLSTQFVEFASLNNTDVSTSVDNVSSVLNAFGMDASDAGGMLDVLNKVGQSTGLSMDTLAQDLSSNAAQLKDMGLNATQSAQFLGQVEMSGLDVSTAMAGMKKAMKNASDDGKTLDQALKDFSDTMHSNQSDTEKLQAAYDLFGSKAGASIYNAMQTGKLSFDGFSSSMSDFAGNVESTFNEMLDPLDQMTVILNQLKDIGAELVDAAGPMLVSALTAVKDAVAAIKSAWDGLSPGAQEAIVKAALIAAAIGPVLVGTGKVVTAVGSITQGIGKLTPIITSIIPAVSGAMSAIVPVLPIIAAVVAAIAAVILIIKNWGAISQWFEGIWSVCCEGVKALGQGLADFFVWLWDGIKTTTEVVWNGIKDFLVGLWDGIGSLASSTWSAITNAISTALSVISSLITAAWTGIRDTIASIFTGIQNVISSAWNAITNVIRSAMDGVKNVITSGLNAAKDAAGDILNGLKERFSAVMENVKSIVSGALSKITGFFSSCHLELPKIKLPHFKITGDFSLVPPSVPHIGVDWYRKAMDDAYLLNSPTIFGASGGKLLGAGEAGQEAVVGTDKLAEIVRSAVEGVGGTTVIPVYIGQERIDEIVVKATQRSNYRSGGR